VNSTHCAAPHYADPPSSHLFLFDPKKLIISLSNIPVYLFNTYDILLNATLSDQEVEWETRMSWRVRTVLIQVPVILPDIQEKFINRLHDLINKLQRSTKILTPLDRMYEIILF
jgi:hypothetical protein